MYNEDYKKSTKDGNEAVRNSILFLCVVKFVMFVGKSLLFLRTINLKKSASESQQGGLLILSGVLGSSAYLEAVWVVKLFFKFLEAALDTYWARILLFAIRLSWIANIVEYCLIGFFLLQLVKLRKEGRKYQYFVVCLFCVIALSIFYLAVTEFSVTNPADYSLLHTIIYKIYLGFVPLSLLPGFYFSIKAIKNPETPRILRQQLVTLFKYFLIPHVVLICILSHPILLEHIKASRIDSYIVFTCSDLLSIGMLYFCIRHILKLRFLNVSKHVQAPTSYNFIDDFKEILIRFSKIVKLDELQHVTTQFFERAFRLERGSVELHLCEHGIQATDTRTTDSGDPTVEQLFLGESQLQRELAARIAQSRILIRDEIGFDYFYEEQPYQKALLDFMNTLSTDIFLPIYERSVLVGYIIVRAGARPAQLYSNIERDEMCVFAAYLGAIINLLQHRNLMTMIRNEKELKDELFLKQQEINHYKESIRSILKDTHRQVGMIFVKGRTLVWGNETIREMLQITSATAKHPIYTPQLFQLARDVRHYNSERSVTHVGPHKVPIVFQGIPVGDSGGVVILASYPDAAERFTIPFDALKDVSSWEYALYLETTRSGQLIHQLIPGGGEVLFNFKIDLLKIALSKQGALLELPEEDVGTLVELIHTISLRETLHTLVVSHQEVAHEFGMELFGMEPLVAPPNAQPCLFERLHERGTLHIEHVDRLSIDTQDRLAEFLTTGLYQPLRSKRFMRSVVRVICSTQANLPLLVDQKRFSRDLFEALRDHGLSFPSLVSLPRHTLKELVTSIAVHSGNQKAVRNLAHMSDRDTQTLIAQAPSSLQSLKQTVEHTLVDRSVRTKVRQAISLESLDEDMTPELADAIRQGKEALRSKKLMALLWRSFKNQAKIAMLLNVNRSSINRRLREFQIIREQ